MAAAAATTNGDNNTTTATSLDPASKAPPNTIIPPASVIASIEASANYVARNGPAFEERIRNNNATNPKFSFINPDDAYHPYYQWRLSEHRAGRGVVNPAGQKAGEVTFSGREERKGPEKPEEFAFSARVPSISALDLEVVKLTALFVARNGKAWMTGLSQREAGNFQFDFLRPQHSLYQFFSRLVDQYKELLEGGEVEDGAPQRRRVERLEADAKDRFRVLERAKKRAEWAKYQAAQKVVKEEMEEKERITYAQIDWHDFVVVETVVFDERDEEAVLPAPTSLNDLQSASLEQKAAMRIAADRRIEEAVPGMMDEYDAFYGAGAGAGAGAQTQPQMPLQAPTTAATQPIPQTYSPAPPQPQAQFQPPSQPHQQPTTASATNPNAPLKIRKDYIPTAQLLAQKSSSTTTSICPNCHRAIPNDEMAQHLRIEMLDPNWREQFRKGQERSATTNLSTSDVARNLKRLASQRTDVFEASGAGNAAATTTREEGERAGKRVEVGGVGGEDGGVGGEGNARPDVQEQIRMIHERARNG